MVWLLYVLKVSIESDPFMKENKTLKDFFCLVESLETKQTGDIWRQKHRLQINTHTHTLPLVDTYRFIP